MPGRRTLPVTSTTTLGRADGLADEGSSTSAVEDGDSSTGTGTADPCERTTHQLSRARDTATSTASTAT